MRLKYGNVELKVYNDYSITKSSQNVTINDLSLDFTNHPKEDLPQKYQEVQLIDNDEVTFFGYVDDYDLGEMREKDVEIDLNITLLSPMKLTTLRTATAIGNYELKELISDIILKPLIDDGFTIEEIELGTKQVTVNFLSETIERCLNNLSNDHNFWWFIDENKKIYIRDLELMFKGESKYRYDDTHRINGLMYIKPTVSSENYANVVNFKNVRVYSESYVSFAGTTITNEQNKLIDENMQMKQGDILNFNHPIDITVKNIIKSKESHKTSSIYYFDPCPLSITGKYTDNTKFEVYMYVSENQLIIPNNVGFDGSNENTQDFLLLRDSFFSNLIVGIKYNGTKTIKQFNSINSDSALVWTVNSVYNDKAIADKRNVISKSGIIEYTIDMKESWHTLQELREIAISYMKNNSLELDGEIEMKMDACEMRVGDLIYINKMLINNKFIVTSIQSNYYSNELEYVVKCKNANMLNNFIDVFRGKTEQQTTEKSYNYFITHYSEEEIKEVHEVVQ